MAVDRGPAHVHRHRPELRGPLGAGRALVRGLELLVVLLRHESARLERVEQRVGDVARVADQQQRPRTRQQRHDPVGAVAARGLLDDDRRRRAECRDRGSGTLDDGIEARQHQSPHLRLPGLPIGVRQEVARAPAAEAVDAARPPFAVDVDRIAVPGNEVAGEQELVDGHHVRRVAAPSAGGVKPSGALRSGSSGSARRRRSQLLPDRGDPQIQVRRDSSSSRRSRASRRRIASKAISAFPQSDRDLVDVLDRNLHVDDLEAVPESLADLGKADHRLAVRHLPAVVLRVLVLGADAGRTRIAAPAAPRRGSGRGASRASVHLRVELEVAGGSDRQDQQAAGVERLVQRIEAGFGGGSEMWVKTENE